MRRFVVLLAALAGAPGCVADQLDPPPSGVFACEVDEDCPDEMTCALERCQDAALPTIEIRTPEADESVAARPDDPPGTMTLTIGLGGDALELVDPVDGPQADFGSGRVEILVDGEPAAIVMAGNLVSGVAVEVSMSDTPGPHRILARALTVSGARYDNLAAVATRVVWVDDGRPRVALVRPWPGDTFPLEDTELEVEISTINFSLIPVTDPGPDPGGHAHVHYDDTFPACADDPACDCCYIGILGPGTGTKRRASGTMRLPPAAAAPASLTAILRTTAHPPFVDAQGELVFDTIEIERRAELP